MGEHKKQRERASALTGNLQPTGQVTKIPYMMEMMEIHIFYFFFFYSLLSKFVFTDSILFIHSFILILFHFIVLRVLCLYICKKIFAILSKKVLSLKSVKDFPNLCSQTFLEFCVCIYIYK